MCFMHVVLIKGSLYRSKIIYQNYQIKCVCPFLECCLVELHDTNENRTIIMIGIH